LIFHLKPKNYIHIYIMLHESFSYTKGYIYLNIKAEIIDQVKQYYGNKWISDKWEQNHQARDGDNYHITITKIKGEYPEDANYYILGLAVNKGVAYLVCKYNSGEKLCKKHKINTPDFHITIGFEFKDNHEIRKDITTISDPDMLYQAGIDEYIKCINETKKSDTSIISHLHTLLPLDYNIHKSYIRDMLLMKTDHNSIIDEMDVMIMNGHENDGTILKLKYLSKVGKITYGDLIGSWKIISNIQPGKMSKNDIEQIVALYNKRGDRNSQYVLSDTNTIIRLDKPKNYSQIDDRVFASGVIRSDHYQFLQYNKIDAIINLMESAKSSIKTQVKRYYHYPIDDRKATTKERINEMIDIIMNHDRVIIHCLGGKGRTAMLFYSYLIRIKGMKIYEIKQKYKDDRETIFGQGQVDFLEKYEQNPYNPMLKHLIYKGEKAPRMIIMCGLPGAGKSTFTKHFLQYYQDDMVRISIDEYGYKGCCQIVMDNIKKKTVLVDICNVTAEYRKNWLEFMVGGKAWCIFLDTPVEECIYRAQNRKDHETLRPSGAKRIITEENDILVPPTKNEGFSQIIHFTKIEEINHQLKLWKLDPIEGQIDTRFFKFPRTRHLFNLGSATRDDLLLTPVEQKEFLNCKVYVEEKVDGANLGISIDPDTYGVQFQNRSHFVTSNYHKQFEKLDTWLGKNSIGLFEIIEPGRHILFGEWLYMKHSINYVNLPGYFVAFDLYDRKEKKFYSRNRLEELLSKANIPIVPLLEHCEFKKLDELVKIAKTTESSFYDGFIEGVYVKKSDDMWVTKRGKIVRSDFIIGNKFWSKGIHVINGIESDY
jgi:hypothetical protein